MLRERKGLANTRALAGMFVELMHLQKRKAETLEQLASRGRTAADVAVLLSFGPVTHNG